MTSITHKRVEYTELFYDLVFVYAISKTTALIHHLDNGMVTFESMLTFFIDSHYPTQQLVDSNRIYKSSRKEFPS